MLRNSPKFIELGPPKFKSILCLLYHSNFQKGIVLQGGGRGVPCNIKAACELPP